MPDEPSSDKCEETTKALSLTWEEMVNERDNERRKQIADQVQGLIGQLKTDCPKDAQERLNKIFEEIRKKPSFIKEWIESQDPYSDYANSIDWSPVISELKKLASEKRVESTDNIKNFLLSKMEKEKKVKLDEVLTAKYPSPYFLEKLLSDLQGAPSIENVLGLIRSNPKQTMDYCSILAVGQHYLEKSMKVNFLETKETKNYDLDVGDNFAVEVKRLEDPSKWGDLISRISEISSDYAVQVDTDFEILDLQLNKIVEDVSETFKTLKDDYFEKIEAWAELRFTKVNSKGKTLPIVGSRETQKICECDIKKKLRPLIRQRIEEAKEQLRISNKTKVVAIDLSIQNLCDYAILDQIFCGIERERIEEYQNKTTVTTFREKDGLIYEKDTMSGVDFVTIFCNEFQIATYFAPENSPSRDFIDKIGNPHGCS